jgi:hypothetical protein
MTDRISQELRELRELLALSRAALREAPNPTPSMRTALIALEAQGHALTLLDTQMTAGAAVVCRHCRKPIGRNTAIDVWHAMN